MIAAPSRLAHAAAAARLAMPVRATPRGLTECGEGRMRGGRLEYYRLTRRAAVVAVKAGGARADAGLTHTPPAAKLRVAVVGTAAEGGAGLPLPSVAARTLPVRLAVAVAACVAGRGRGRATGRQCSRHRSADRRGLGQGGEGGHGDGAQRGGKARRGRRGHGRAGRGYGAALAGPGRDLAGLWRGFGGGPVQPGHAMGGARTAIHRARLRVAARPTPAAEASAFAGLTHAMAGAAALAAADIAVDACPTRSADAVPLLAAAVRAAPPRAPGAQLADISRVAVVAGAARGGVVLHALAAGGADGAGGGGDGARDVGTLGAGPAPKAHAPALHAPAVPGAARRALTLAARVTHPAGRAHAAAVGGVAAAVGPIAVGVGADGLRLGAVVSAPPLHAHAPPGRALPVRTALVLARQHVARLAGPAGPARAAAIAAAVAVGATAVGARAQGAVDGAPPLVASACVRDAGAVPGAVVEARCRAAVGARPEEVAGALAIDAGAVATAAALTLALLTRRAAPPRRARAHARRGATAAAVGARRSAHRRVAVGAGPSGLAEAAKLAVPYGPRAVPRARGRVQRERLAREGEREDDGEHSGIARSLSRWSRPL